MEHVWRWFCEIAGARTSNGFGANPISYGEIAAWASLTGQDVSPWEARLLRRVDAAVLNVLNSKDKPEEDAPLIECQADDAVAVKSLMRGLQLRSGGGVEKPAPPQSTAIPTAPQTSLASA